MIPVAAFYRFAPVADPPAAVARLRAASDGLCGTVLVAPEGVNGTVAGPRDGLDRLLDAVAAEVGPVAPRWSEAAAAPFGRMKVRLKREIVSMGCARGDPAAGVGAYVPPAAWNAVLRDPSTVVVDVRNDYEVAIGSFEGAEDPGTPSFRDFPAWWDANRARLAGKRVAMFCTGGIRCEKATALARAEGAEVVHLRGGILGYLAEVPPEESLWRGGCFVFDGRVALGHGLAPTGHGLCHGCRRPIGTAERADPAFEAGVSCPACADALTEADRARLRERRRQMALAEARGARHLGRRDAG